MKNYEKKKIHISVLIYGICLPLGYHRLLKFLKLTACIARRICTTRYRLILAGHTLIPEFEILRVGTTPFLSPSIINDER